MKVTAMQLRWMAALAVALAMVPLAYAAKSKEKLPERYARWVNEEVTYIITDEERKMFMRLDTDEARDKYIEEFWDVRNPQRGSGRNPYKEEHYNRIEYANAHFGRQSNTPGWMTDMGRAYILFGKPESRQPFIGHGQLYPTELWFYSNTGNPGLPPFFNLLFFIPEDIGEYRFYRPSADTPLALVRGSQFTSNGDVYRFLLRIGGDLAHAAFTLVPNDPIDRTDFSVDLTSDFMINKIKNFANSSFNLSRIRELRSLRAKVDSYFLVAQDKPLDIGAIVLADPLGQYWLDYAVTVDDVKLGVADAATKQFRLALAYRLTNEAGDMIVEDTDEGAYSALDDQGNFRRFVVAGRLPLAPGKYKLEVQVSNRAAGRTYKGEQKISVGPADKIAMTGPLLASAIERVGRPDAMTPFQYFGVQFHPAAQRRFIRRDPLRLLFELEEAHGAPHDYQVEYVLAHIHDRDARRTLTDTIAASEFENGHLLKSKTIPLTELESGDYRLVINVRPAGSSEVALSVNTPLKIEDEQAEAPLFFLANSRKIAAPGVAAYIRALEWMSQKNATAAADSFAKSLAQNPSNSFAGQYLVQLYFAGRRYGPVKDLYNKLGITPFKNSPEALAQISLSFWQTGDKGQARDILEAARSYFPDNALLASTAAGLQATKR
jgi:GWxTD domain-containing protein